MEEYWTIVNIATAVVTVASAAANLTKTDRDNQAVGWLSKLVNFFALNFRPGQVAPPK